MEIVKKKPVCESCGDPVPATKKGRQRLYCDNCRDERHREVACMYYRNHRGKPNKVPAVQNGQMLRLGMDYVQLKLAGLIRMPKVSRQIVITGDKHYGESG